MKQHLLAQLARKNDAPAATGSLTSLLFVFFVPTAPYAETTGIAAEIGERCDLCMS